MSDTGVPNPLPEPPAEMEESDPLHIGNLIEILSVEYGPLVGRVVYRDDRMLRVVSQEESDRAYEFSIQADGSFDPALDVQSVEVIEEQPSDYYVDFLGARPGEMLEFFTLDGKEAAPTGEVAEIIKSATKDSIRLTDGRTIRFGGVGPKPPIAVVRVRTAENIAAAEVAGVAAAEGAVATADAEPDILALLNSVLPAATMAIVPTAERVFPDSMQREDLFQDLLAGISEKQKTNPRRIRAIEREVDMAVALKNKIIQRDAAGRVTGTVPVTIETIGDAAAAAASSGSGLPAIIPIVQAARVLNLDASEAAATHKESDVHPRLLGDIEAASETAAKQYEEGAGDRNFAAFAFDLLSRDQITLDGAHPFEWVSDQEVIRTAGLGEPVQGLAAGLPAAIDDEAPPVSIAFLSSDVTDRITRVLTADRIEVRRSGAMLRTAPSDPSKVVGHVLLPTKAALALRPPSRPGHLPTALLYSERLQDDNLPTIAAALRNLYASAESVGPLTAWTVTPETATDAKVADWLKTVLKYAVHPIDSMGPRTPQLLSLLDTLGLDNRDLAAPVKAVIDKWVGAAQKQWRDLLVAERTRIKALMEDEPDRTFQSVTGDDSPVWPALRGAASLKELLDDIETRNPTIAGAPLVTAASLLLEAQGDATPLVWSTLSETSGIDPVAAASALGASRAYLLRRKALRDIALMGLRAEPEINTCEHVERLESIRNVSDVLNRSRLLRDFVETYQGGRSGDWVTCRVCNQECVCYHEIMELEALAQPARMESLTRELIVRYGGDRFEGKIICRNCGQALTDIDYDEHVEFDDEGRPMTQRSVLTEEQMEDPTEGFWKKSTAALAGPTLTFKTEGLRYLHEILQRITERGGFTLPDDAVRMIVTYADQFVKARTPPQAAYEAKRRQAMASAATRISTKGGVVALPEPPTFAAYVDDLRVMSLTGLTVIALQTAVPPIVVNPATPICKYTAEGWPLNPGVAPNAEPGTLNYMACTVALIARDEVPWKHMKWSGEEKPESRIKKVVAGLETTMTQMLVPDAKGNTLPFTSALRTMLTEVQSNATLVKERALVSVRDQLPVGFRPEAFPAKMERPGVERDPVPPIEAALAAGGSVNEMVPAIAAASRQQAIAIVGELHDAAQKFVDAMTMGKPVSVTDSVCCPVPLAAADREAALLGGAENARLLEARTLVRGGNPTAVNAGTHYWEVPTVPAQSEVKQAVDEGVYFKLFLKYCYVGAQPGAVHEFSVGNICRQCGLALGKPLDLIDFSTEGAGILGAQQGSLKVEVTQGAFDALSDAVRRRKIFESQPAVAQAPWRLGLESLVAACRARTDLAEDAGPKACATAIQAVLDAVAGHELEAMSEVDRAALWAPVTAHMDELERGVGAAIGPILTGSGGGGVRAKARSDEARKALKQLVALTEDPYVESAASLQEYWCAKTQAAAAGFAVRNVRGARWMKISEKHNELLSRILTDNADWFAGEITPPMRPVLGAVAGILGPLLRVWKRAVRPAAIAETAWTKAEASMILRCLVLHAWHDSVTSDSWMYGSIATSAERVSTAAAVADWTRALMFHAGRQFSRYEREKVQKILQQRAEMERTSVVEEFSSLKDDDLRAAEYIKKQLRIGRWGLAAKGFREYDADLFDAEIEQRRRMGIVDAPVNPILLAGAAAAAAGDNFGLGGLDAGPEEGYNVNQAADGDDY